MRVTENFLFTSESVCEGHPDKICDQISDAILDACLEQDPDSRVAVEASTKTGYIMAFGELNTRAVINIPQIVRGVVKNIGYDSSEKCFDYKTCAVIVSIDSQSPEISQAVEHAHHLSSSGHHLNQISENHRDLPNINHTNPACITPINTSITDGVTTNPSNIRINPSTSDTNNINSNSINSTPRVNPSTSDINNINSKSINRTSRVNPNTSDTNNINSNSINSTPRVNPSTSDTNNINSNSINSTSRVNPSTSDTNNINSNNINNTTRVNPIINDNTNSNFNGVNNTTRVNPNTNDNVYSNINGSASIPRTLTSDSDDIGAGDQGLMFGYATDETEQFMPATVVYAHAITYRLSYCRKKSIIPWLRPDGKSQVTFEYAHDVSLNGSSPEPGEGALIPLRVHTVVVSVQTDPDVPLAVIRNTIRTEVIEHVIPKKYLDENTIYHIQPSGSFVVGGPQSDSGLTGRKIIVDTYGGWGAHGGGCFSGKDYTKVDRSGAYAARWIALSLVAAGLCRRCLIQISYAIGIAEPLSININTYGTSVHPSSFLLNVIRNNFKLTPSAIVRELDLKKPIYFRTATFGHFKTGFSWEKPKILKY